MIALSVREFELLVALATRAGRIVRREELFALVWRAPLRNGDRSVDVYVHKLRVKLEEALPGVERTSTRTWASAIACTPSVHTTFTTRSQARDRRSTHRPRVCRVLLEIEPMRRTGK